MINYHIRLWGTASTTMASNVKKCQYLIATVVVDVARKYYHVSPKRTKMGEDQASLQYVYHRVQGNARHLLNFFFFFITNRSDWKYIETITSLYPKLRLLVYCCTLNKDLILIAWLYNNYIQLYTTPMRLICNI